MSAQELVKSPIANVVTALSEAPRTHLACDSLFVDTGDGLFGILVAPISADDLLENERCDNRATWRLTFATTDTGLEHNLLALKCDTCKEKMAGAYLRAMPL